MRKSVLLVGLSRMCTMMHGPENVIYSIYIRGFIWKAQPDNSSLLSDVGIFLTDMQISQKLTASINKAMDLPRSIQLYSNDVYKNRSKFAVKGS